MSKSTQDVSRHKQRRKLNLFLLQPRRQWIPYFVLVVTLLLTVFTSYYVAIATIAQDKLQFENTAQRTQYDIQNRLETYTALLRAGSGLFAANEQISRDDFHTFVDRLDLQNRYPGIQGIGFSARVMPQEKAALVARMQNQGMANFTIKPEFKRAEYHSILYLEPLNERNKVAIGFDMSTEQVRRTAMERARDTGTAAASGRVTLVQEIDEQKQAGFLIYVPVYRNGTTPRTLNERRAALTGFVYSAFRTHDFPQGIFGEHQPAIDFQIYDGTDLSSKNLLYRYSNQSGAADQHSLTATKTINVAGRTWSIFFASRSDQLASGRSALYILVGGLAISFVLFKVTRSQVNAEQQIQKLNTSLERQVQQRTAQLQQALDFEATLKRLTDKVRDSLDEHQILQTAVQELTLALGIICCDAAVYNLDEGTSSIRYAYTASNQGMLTTPSAKGSVVQMADIPEIYSQLCNGQYFQFCELTFDPIRSQVAVLSCPIVDNQGALGDLWLFNHKNKAFDQLEIRLVQQVANQCAIAMRQARLYQAATAQVKELEKLNALKDDFLSTVSHELRTPIANMKMAIQMLRISGGSQERRERYLDILQTECNRESELINDLLDLQRLEAGSYPSLLMEAINLQDWLPSIIEPFRVRTRQRQQTLSLSLPSHIPVLISYRASLERVLVELLNNACKYTPSGSDIIFRVCYKSTEAVTFTISNPLEIPAAELPRIFDKFYRVPNNDPWKQGGTGLGLALVQKLIEQLQGSIEVESAQGWTTFTVQLPNQSVQGASHESLVLGHC